MKQRKSIIAAFTFWARNLRSAEMFRALTKYSRGKVLDVGGRDFFLTVQKHGIPFESWVNLEPGLGSCVDIDDPQFSNIVGDGCRMEFADGSFDTVINLQVLEHVFEPFKMVKEIYRVLRPSGYAIFLIPQTSVLHELPAHYYNFTLPWIDRAMKEVGFKIMILKPLGGFWSSKASHFLYFFFHAFRLPGYSLKEFRRSWGFYVLFPLMTVYAIVSLPLCLFLSLGDLGEAPNNYLVVVQK